MLLGEVTERRRRASFDETIALAVSAVSSAPVAPVPPVNPPLDFQSVFASVALGFAQSAQLPDPSLSVAATPVSDVPAVVASSPAAPDSEGNENARFLASLPFDLRQDVLLSADAAFLQSLPLLAQAEARQMRSQGRASSMLSGLVAREGSQLLRDRSISEFSDMIDQVRMGDGVGFPGSVIAARRRDRETAFGILESRGRGVPEEAVPPPGMTAVAVKMVDGDVVRSIVPVATCSDWRRASTGRKPRPASNAAACSRSASATRGLTSKLVQPCSRSRSIKSGSARRSEAS